MNNQDRLIDAKISILQLAEKLDSISQACKTAGIARSSFYEIKKAYVRISVIADTPIGALRTPCRRVAT